MFERENHFTYVFYWYNYVLFSIDLKNLILTVFS